LHVVFRKGHQTKIIPVQFFVAEAHTSYNILLGRPSLNTWSAVDYPGIDSQVAVHKLSIFREARYVSQKKRKLGEERRLATNVEVAKLLEDGFIVEAHYTTWLANVVLVKNPVANGECVLVIPT